MVWDPKYCFDTSKYGSFDWEILMQISLEHSIFPLIYSKVNMCLPNHLQMKYKICWTLHKRKIKDAMKQAFMIQKTIEESGCRSSIVKGFILSYLIYEDVNLRQFCDIDFIVHKDDMLVVCNIMEHLGYKDGFINCISSIDIPAHKSYKDSYYLSDKEKTFISESGFLVEIKTGKYSYASIEASNAMTNRFSLVIDECSFSCVNIKEMFMHIIENMFFNFYADPGILSDYKIRDILDFYSFILKYQDIFTVDYLKTIENRDHLNHLALSIDILKKYFDAEAISKIPSILLNIEPKRENVFEFIIGWESNFFDRFCRAERIAEYERLVIKREIEISKQFKSKPVSVTNSTLIHMGSINTPISVWTEPTIFYILEREIYFGFEYDKNNIYASLKIPIEFPDMDILYEFCCDELYGEVYKQCVCIELINNKMRRLSSEIGGTKSFMSDFDNYSIVTISIPRHGSIKHVNECVSDYFLFFRLMYSGTEEFIGRRGSCGIDDNDKVYKFSIAEEG